MMVTCAVSRHSAQAHGRDISYGAVRRRSGHAPRGSWLPGHSHASKITFHMLYASKVTLAWHRSGVVGPRIAQG